MSQATKILDFLYLGAYREALYEKNTGSLGITHILNVKESTKFDEVDQLRSLHVPLFDYGATELRPIFPRCFRFIEEAREGGGKVLVHCRSGQNRSATIVVGYLTFVHGLTLRESWDLVSSLRTVVCIVEPYWRQLQALEREIKLQSTFNYEELKTQLLIALQQQPA